MLVKLMKSKEPDYLVFCYDRKEPSFRKDLDPNYKANRTEMPDDLAPQIPYIKTVAQLMGIPGFEVERYEADDIIGAVTDFARRNHLEVVIVSGDKDFGQLIEPGVTLYDTMKEVVYDSAGVKEKWGIEPKQVIDYLALVGDSSDNIPGVAGVGPKGAQKLLADFGTLENIYKNLDKISSASLREKLITSKDNAFLSQKLVTIAKDVPLDLSLEKLTRKPADSVALRALLQDLNFKSFEKSLLGDEQVPKSADSQADVVSSSTPATENSHVAFVLDESSSVEQDIQPQDGKKIFTKGAAVWGLSSDSGLFIAFENKVYRLAGERKDWGEVLTPLQLQWQGHELKPFWRELEIDNPRTIWSSALAAYVVRPGSDVSFTALFTKYTGSVLPALMTGTQLYKASLRLREELEKALVSVAGGKVLADLELPLEPILYDMERAGVRIDEALLKKQSDSLAQDIRGLEKEIFASAGENFNIGSPKQLGHILFEKLKLPVGKKTKTGYSTDTDVLDKLMEVHPIAKLVIQYRELTKLKSTYVDALPLLVNPQTHRLHTTFNQAHTATGRLSSTNPNLQNIPIRTERGSQIRRAFIARDGNLLVSADYSQIELRILAHITEDPGLCRAFSEGLDIHTATAAEVFSVALKDVTPDLRRKAKAVNFGIAYGQGAFGLAENLGISRSEATDIIKNYFKKFSGVSRYMDETIERAKEKGYVETLFGRRRYLDELQSKSAMVRKFGERAAINAPIQGTASDLVKMAMINLRGQTSLQMLLQVHDELIFEGPKDEVPSEMAKICKYMESVAQLKVPLQVNCSSGLNWGEAH